MITNEFADMAAQQLLDQRFEVRSTPPGLFADRSWCSIMGSKQDGSKTRTSASPAVEPVCGRLRVLFDVADEPMPESLANLADRLDAAFVRGDLSQAKPKGPAR